MKTLLTIVLGLFLFVACNEDDDPIGNWIEKNSFEGDPRYSAVSFVIGDKAYVGLGYNNDLDDEYLTDFWEYDPLFDSWNPIADFPGVGRQNAAAFSVDGKGYVGTGYDGDVRLKDFWEYDPTTDTWTQKDDLLGAARTEAVGFSLNNYGYIGTGEISGESDITDFYRFDPTADAGKQWTKVQSIGGQKRSAATAFTYNNKAYVCTGSSNGTSLTDMWEYDPTADSWTRKEDLDDDDSWTIVRDRASSFVLNGRGYIALGRKSSLVTTVWEYNFSADTWNQKTDFEGTARSYAVAFAVGGKAIVATGTSGSSSYFYDVWEFLPFAEYDDDEYDDE